MSNLTRRADEGTTVADLTAALKSARRVLWWLAHRSEKLDATETEHVTKEIARIDDAMNKANGGDA